VTPSRRLLAALVTVTVVAGFVPAATADDLDDDLNDVRARMSALDDQLESASASRGTLAGEVKAAKARLDEVIGALDALGDELAAVRAQQAVKERQLEEARSRLAEQYQTLALTRSDLAGARTDATDWAVETYMSAGSGIPEVAFSASAWNDLTIGVEYLDRVTESGVAAVARFEALLGAEERATTEIEATEAALIDDVAALEAGRVELEAVEADLEAKREELRAEVDRQRALLARVEGQIAELEGELAALEKEEGDIKALIASRASSEGRAPGRLVRPVPGAIGSGFGPRYHPILGYVRMHNGVDMHCDAGDPIVAAASGTVILAGTKGGYGNTVMIDHGGGMVTLYAHQSRFAASYGDKVEAGQVIGYCGSTGLSTEPHLHFEVRIKGVPQNPADYL
jgi:murein DD-endopeptidase MepM/ murein hydrolase activator NlpD